MSAHRRSTLVLDVGAGRPRRTSLVPPVHVALVSQARLVATYADAIGRVVELDPVPSSVHLITGPSRSADIEMQLVRGVHGPGAVHVVLFPAS
jgi:L-lactate utilization protein LutC